MNREDFVQTLLDYVDHSPTPFHAVAQASTILRNKGFTRLKETDTWDLSVHRQFYIERGGSSLIAISLGQAPLEETGMRIVAAHTDSPTLRIKPLPCREQQGYRQLATEVYGSPLWSTWLDRDLSLAGRVLVGDTPEALTSHLVHIKQPLVRIPNLAIHLNRSVNSEGLKLNAQQHLVPIVGLKSSGAFDLQERLREELHDTLPDSVGTPIQGWDLVLYDCQPSTQGGHANEFVFAPRLDDLACCYAGLNAIAEAPTGVTTHVLVLFDHEECGSGSVVGADSSFLRDILTRVVATVSENARDPQTWGRTMAQSTCLSADMAHAVHPNYAEQHEPTHRPILGGGPVLKTNANQSYATDGEGWARLRLLCQQANIPLQHFVSRSDLACGSTVGPLTAARLGIRTLDIGSPLLAMHSVREMASGADLYQLSALLEAFFHQF